MPFNLAIPEMLRQALMPPASPQAGAATPLGAGYRQGLEEQAALATTPLPAPPEQPEKNRKVSIAQRILGALSGAGHGYLTGAGISSGPTAMERLRASREREYQQSTERAQEDYRRQMERITEERRSGESARRELRQLDEAAADAQAAATAAQAKVQQKRLDDRRKLHEGLDKEARGLGLTFPEGTRATEKSDAIAAARRRQASLEANEKELKRLDREEEQMVNLKGVRNALIDGVGYRDPESPTGWTWDAEPLAEMLDSPQFSGDLEKLRTWSLRKLDAEAGTPEQKRLIWAQIEEELDRLGDEQDVFMKQLEQQEAPQGPPAPQPVDVGGGQMLTPATPNDQPTSPVYAGMFPGQTPISGYGAGQVINAVRQMMPQPNAQAGAAAATGAPVAQMPAVPQQGAQQLTDALGFTGYLVSLPEYQALTPDQQLKAQHFVLTGVPPRDAAFMASQM